jgi:hypothetical protein
MTGGLAVLLVRRDYEWLGGAVQPAMSPCTQLPRRMTDGRACEEPSIRKTTSSSN